jgi:hypothetical protein
MGGNLDDRIRIRVPTGARQAELGGHGDRSEDRLVLARQLLERLAASLSGPQGFEQVALV